jgi:hypothetical protein
MTLKPFQYAQIATGYHQAAVDASIPPDKQDEFARKAEWFRFLATRDRGGTLGDESDRSKMDFSFEGSPPAPKRSLKPFLTTLWLAGAGIYLIGTVLFTNAINVVGDKNSEVSRQVASTRDFASNEEPARVKPAVPPSSLAPYRRHAISPGQPPYESPDLIVPPSAMGEGHNTSPVSQTEQVSVPPAIPEPEVVEVREAASIRNGPSPTAVVIGTASPGAQLQIKAQEKGWIQFIDPSSGNSGWIESYSVTTRGSAQDGSNVAVTQAEDSPSLPVQKPKPVKTRVKNKPSKPSEIAKQRPTGPPAARYRYTDLPEDEEFIANSRPRRSGLLAKRRMLREGLMSPDFIPPQ